MDLIWTNLLLKISFRALESVLIDQPKTHRGQSAKDDGTIDDIYHIQEG